MSKFERSLFYAGVMGSAGIFLFIVIGSILKIKFVLKCGAVITASIAGGRIASILTGLELQMSSLSIIVLLFIFNACWLFFLFPLISTFYHDVLEIKIFGKMLHSTKTIAQYHKSKIAQTGSWSLPVFIWLPFPWTGGMIGAVIGMLLGIPTERLMIITLSAMLAGIVSWTFGFKYMIILTGTTGKIVSIAVLLIVLFLSFVKMRRNSNKVKVNP